MRYITPVLAGRTGSKHSPVRPAEAVAAFPGGPLHIEAGTEEVVIDDSRRLHHNALRDAAEAELVITEGAPHIWQHFASFLPEARDSLNRIGHFISAHIPD